MLLSAIVIFAIGVAVVISRTTTIQPVGRGTFGAVGGNPYVGGGPQTLSPDIGGKNPVINAFVGTTTVLPYGNDTETSGPTPGPGDYDSFIEELIGSSKTSGTGNNNSGVDTSEVYAFIPQGLLGINSPSKISSTQQALQDFGNQAGTIIHAYEAHDSNQIQVLKDALEDRQSVQKAAGVEQIGNDLIDVGTRLLRIPAIPQEVSGQNSALAKAYQDAGQKLIKVAQASTLRDADFVSVIETYNASADQFAKNFTALALIFSSYGVHFAASDPGAVFSFSSGNGISQ
jgi:hypothetical protein